MKHGIRQIARRVPLLAVLAAVISWAPAGAARTNRWQPFPGLPVPRAGLAAAPGPCGLIYAIAGFQGEPPNTPASHLLDVIRVG